MIQNHNLGLILDLGYALELCCVKTEEIRRETVEKKRRRPYIHSLEALWDVVMKKVDEKYVN